MNRLFSYVAVPATALALALSSTGCKTDCEKQDGKTVCKSETTVQYQGTQQPIDVNWTSGTKLTINVRGGNVRVGFASTSVTISRGGAAGKVTGKFSPFVSMTKDEETQAKEQMSKNLVLSATGADTGVTIDVSQTGTHQSSLSATVDVVIPDDFNGDIDVRSESGDLSIQGAAKGVYATTSLGDVAVTWAYAPQAADTSTITSGQGDITVTLPQASVATIQAQSGADGTVDASRAVGAQEQVAAPSSKTLTFNGGSTNPWQVTNKDFTFANIAILTN